jgi:toxin ParE1/3/4
LKAKYSLTKKALKDLSEIWNYTFDNWSESQADMYYIAIISSLDEIANKPMLGKDYGEITTGLLGFKVNKHIVFYFKGDNGEIKITRILHERMDLKNRVVP